MAEMTTGEKNKLLKVMMETLSAFFENTGSLSKGDLAAAIDAQDTFFNANASAINNQFPTATKDNMSASQKALFIASIIIARYMVDGSNSLEMMMLLVGAIKAEVS